MRALYVLLLLVTVAFGAPHATALFYGMIGPWSAVALEPDGTRTHMAFGPDLPRPEWVPVLPGAAVVQSSRLRRETSPAEFGSLDVATRAPLDEIRRFYRDRLRETGFEVADRDPGPHDTTVFGITAILSARRTTGEEVQVIIRVPEGLVPSRLVQLTWRTAIQ
jgi:hypothetical protein